MSSTWEDFEAEMADINVDAIVAEETGHLADADPFGGITGADVLVALEPYGPTEQEKMVFSTNSSQLSDDGFAHLMGEAYLAAKARKEIVAAQDRQAWADNQEQARKDMTILNALGLFISVEKIKRGTDLTSISEDALMEKLVAILQATVAVAMGQAMFAWSFKTADDGSLDAVHHLIDTQSGEMLHWLCI